MFVTREAFPTLMVFGGLAGAQGKPTGECRVCQRRVFQQYGLTDVKLPMSIPASRPKNTVHCRQFLRSTVIPRLPLGSACKVFDQATRTEITASQVTNFPATDDSVITWGKPVSTKAFTEVVWVVKTVTRYSQSDSSGGLPLLSSSAPRDTVTNAIDDKMNGPVARNGDSDTACTDATKSFNDGSVVHVGSAYFKIKCATDFYGGDEFKEPSFTHTFDACLDLCRQDQRCVAVSWRKDPGVKDYGGCYLKDKKMQGVPDERVISACKSDGDDSKNSSSSILSVTSGSTRRVRSESPSTPLLTYSSPAQPTSKLTSSSSKVITSSLGSTSSSKKWTPAPCSKHANSPVAACSHPRNGTLSPDSNSKCILNSCKSQFKGPKPCWNHHKTGGNCTKPVHRPTTTPPAPCTKPPHCKGGATSPKHHCTKSSHCHGVSTSTKHHCTKSSQCKGAATSTKPHCTKPHCKGAATSTKPQSASSYSCPNTCVNWWKPPRILTHTVTVPEQEVTIVEVETVTADYKTVIVTLSAVTPTLTVKEVETVTVTPPGQKQTGTQTLPRAPETSTQVVKETVFETVTTTVLKMTVYQTLTRTLQSGHGGAGPTNSPSVQASNSVVGTPDHKCGGSKPCPLPTRTASHTASAPITSISSTSSAVTVLTGRPRPTTSFWRPPYHRSESRRNVTPMMNVYFSYALVILVAMGNVF